MTKLVLLVLFSMFCSVRPYFIDDTIISESILFYENSPATFICNDTNATWEIDYGTRIAECYCPGYCGNVLFDESRIIAYCNESSPVLHFKEMKLTDNLKHLQCFGSSWNYRLLVGRRSDYFYPEEPSALVDNNYTLICERDMYDVIDLYDDQKQIGTVSYNYVYNMDEENFDIIAEEWNITLIIKKVKLEDDGKIFGCYSQGNNLSLINLTVDVPPSNVTVTALNGKILYYENSPATFICDNSDAKWMVDDKILTECHCPGDCGNVLFDKSRITAYCNESSPVLHFKEMKLTDNFKRLKCFESLWDFTLLVGNETDTFYPEEPFALAGSSYTLLCEKEWYQGGYLYDDEKTIGTIYYYYYIENLDGENYDFSSDDVNITITIKKVALEDDGKIFGCYLQGNGLSLLNLTVNVPVSSVGLYYIGVLIEDETVTFVCKVYDSKPQASFEWFMLENGSEREITQNIDITAEKNGELWQTTSTLKLKLKRSFKAIKCRARILEMDWTNSRSLQLDIRVPVSSVTLQQTTGLLIEDENKIFVCKVDESRPKAIFEWFLSDNGAEREIVRNIYHSSELNRNLFETTSILNLKLNRSFETIRCRAKIYGMAWTNSNTLQLDVKYPPPGKPIITVNEPNMCIGDQVTIICDWQGGYPNASLNFTCLSQTKANEDYVSITETLTRKMSKYCRCEGKHIARKEFTTYEISIQSRVSSVSLHQEKKNSFIEGKYGIFVCKVDESTNSKAVFQWILLENGSEREITQNIGITSKQNGNLWQTNSTLKLELKRSFNIIKCRARIQEMCWTNSTSLLLDIKYPPPGKPVITVNNPQICAGEQILITCEWRGGHPSASLSLTCVSKTETKEDFVMITEPVTRKMSNYCQCEGKHITKNEFATYNISIQYPPNKVKINRLNIKGNISSLICDASGGFPPVYNYSWSPGNYPPQKQIYIRLNDASIPKLTCTVAHKCKGDNPKSSTIRLFGEESNDIIYVIVAPIIATIIIIIAGSVICFKYRNYSMKKKAAENIRPQSEDATSENIYAHIDIQQNDEPRRHIDKNLEMQSKDEPRRHIDENLEMRPKVEPRRYEHLVMQPKVEPSRYENLVMQPKEEKIYDDVENIEKDDNTYETPVEMTKESMDSSIEFSETETR